MDEIFLDNFGSDTVPFYDFDDGDLYEEEQVSEQIEFFLDDDNSDLLDSDVPVYMECECSILVPYLEQVHSDLEVISFTLTGVLFFVVFSWCFASIRRTVKHMTGRKLNE